jgi:hypothetical protein
MLLREVLIELCGLGASTSSMVSAPNATSSMVAVAAEATMPSARLRNRIRQISRSDLIARSTRSTWKARNSLAACNPPAGTLASRSIQPQRMKRSLSSACCRRIQKSRKKKKQTTLSR